MYLRVTITAVAVNHHFFFTGGLLSAPVFRQDPGQASEPHPALMKRRRSQIEATQHSYPLADPNVEDCIMDQLSMASTPTVQRSTNNTFSKITAPDRGAPIAPPPATYVAVTDGNFKAHRHRHGDCLAHPSVSCGCEKVQPPTMGPNEAWQVMSMRFKAVHRVPDTCWNQLLALLDPLSTGADAPIALSFSDGRRALSLGGPPSQTRLQG